MKFYLAGPLFTQAEQDWWRGFRTRLQQLIEQRGADAEIVWPFELAGPEQVAAWGDRAKHEIFNLCRKHLEDTDIVIALLDGAQVDDGTAWEIGFFYARKRKGHYVLGLRTDFRSAGDAPTATVNLMIDCTCDIIAGSVDELLEEVDRILDTGC